MATNISQFTKNSEDYPLQRWAVKKRIYGSSHFQGLLDRDYLIEKLENKHRYHKQERSFYLTSKGILASFATTPLKNNISFKNIINFANRITKKKQTRFIEEFIISQSKYFLAHLYLQGIQLTWQKDTWIAYSDFLRYSESGIINIEIKDKQIMSEFKKLFEKYVILRSVYHFLGGKVEKDLELY